MLKKIEKVLKCFRMFDCCLLFMRTLLTILIIFIFQQTSFADEQRLTTFFKSENGKYSLKYKKKHWILLNKFGKSLYRIKDKN